jgi:hypothetical protein
MKIIYLLLIIFAFLNANSQSAKITYGPEISDSTNFEDMDFLGQKDDNLYFLWTTDFDKKGDQKFIINKYSKSTLKLLSSSALKEASINNSPLKLRKVLFVENELHLFSLWNDSKDEKCKLYYQKYNLSELKVTTEPIEVLGFNASSFEVSSMLYIGKEENGKFIMHYFQEKMFYFKEYDKNMKCTEDVSFEFPYDKEDLINFDLDSNNMFLLANLESEFSEPVFNKKIKSNYKLLKYNRLNKLIENIDLKVENTNVRNLRMNLKNDVLYISGYYGGEKGKMIVGSYSSLINTKSNTVIKSEYKEFPAIWIETSKDAKSEEIGKQLISYYPRAYKFRSDSGYYFIGEQEYTGTIQTYANPKTGYSITKSNRHTDGIIITSINKRGEIEFVSKLTKSFSSFNTSYLSFFLNENNDELSFYYNGVKKDLVPDSIKLTNKEKRKLAEQLIVIEAKLDRKGNIKRNELIPETEFYQIIPNACFLSSEIDKEIIFFGKVFFAGYRDYVFFNKYVEDSNKNRLVKFKY